MHTTYHKISARERDFAPRYYYKRTYRYTFWERTQNGIRKIIAFLFTQVGVCVLVGFYMIFGAFMFSALEEGSREELAKKAEKTRIKLAKDLWNLTLDTNTLYSEKWISKAELLIMKFQEDVVENARAGYTGMEVGVNIWTFSAALMYSMTIFTTIGYGNLTPRTDFGKGATIFYALVGIPLMLLYMNNIGHILGTSFKYAYSKFCRCNKPNHQNLMMKASLPSSFIETPGLEGDGEKLSKRSSFRSKMSTSTATNTTSMTSKIEEDEIDKEFPDDPLCKHSAAEPTKKKNKMFYHLKTIKPPRTSRPSGNTVEFKLVEDLRLVTVPVTSCLLVLIGYIVFGAILFSAWENWNYMDGAYFCFTSLLTIGFGDFVPGNDYIYHVDAIKHDDVQGKAKLILGATYILLGMALIAMCLNLMQEKIIVQIRTAARRLGLLRPTKFPITEEII